MFHPRKERRPKRNRAHRRVRPNYSDRFPTKYTYKDRKGRHTIDIVAVRDSRGAPIPVRRKLPRSTQRHPRAGERRRNKPHHPAFDDREINPKTLPPMPITPLGNLTKHGENILKRRNKKP